MKNGLDIDDVAKVVADQLRKQKKDLLAHFERRFTLAAVQGSARCDETTRGLNLHRRLTQLESEVRRLRDERSR